MEITGSVERREETRKERQAKQGEETDQENYRNCEPFIPSVSISYNCEKVERNILCVDLKNLGSLKKAGLIQGKMGYIRNSYSIVKSTRIYIAS